MASDSISEVSHVQSPVVKDASEKALAEAGTGAVNPKNYVESTTAALKASGLLPELAIDGAKEIAYVQKNFETIDRSGDGWITGWEIDQYIKDNSKTITNDELEALRKVKEKIGKLEDLSNDEIGWENDGITKDDLEDAQTRFRAFGYAQKNFEKIDSDGDGYLTGTEIFEYIKDNRDLNQADLKKLDYLYKNVSDIEGYSNDEWGSENDGITRNDLNAGKENDGSERMSSGQPVCETVKAIDDLRPALDFARDNFDKIDADKDGFLGKDEIMNFADANKSTLSSDDLAKLVALKKKVSDIEEQSNDEWFDENDGITKKDIEVARPRIDALTYAQDNFDKLDGDGDGFITRGNIDAYIKARGNTSADEERVLKLLKDSVTDIEDYSNDEIGFENDGVTRNDVRDALRELGSEFARYDCNKMPSEAKQKEAKLADTKAGDAKPANSKAEAKPEERTADSGLDYLRKRFAFIDADSDNYITKSEIDKFIKDNEKSLSQAEVKALQKLREKEDDLEEMSNDEFGDENDGITRQDIDVAERQMKAVEFAQKNFDKLDGDGDGFVASSEVSAYIRANSDKLSVQERKVLDYLKNNVSDLEDYSNDEIGFENDGFTKDDLKDALDETGSNTVGVGGNTDKLPLPAPVQYKYDPTTQRVSGEDFTKETLRLFDQLDQDGDGYLSEGELARAVQSEKYTGREAQVVAALYKNQDDLEEISNDEWGDENDGITRDDMKGFDKNRVKILADWKQIEKAKAFLDKDDNFKKTDTDGDEFLTKSEIKKALERKDLSADERSSLEFLRDNYSDLEDASNDEFGFENDGITRKDLNQYGDSTVSTVYNTLTRTNEAQKTASRALYANKENPLDSIKPDAIKQGMIGDCYFEAAVASLAAVDPAAIQKMTTDNGDGTYTVIFPGNTDEPITIKAPTEVELGLFNQGSPDGTWASVLEKAYGEYCNAHWYRRGPRNLFGGDTPTEGADGGELRSGHAMGLLTGRDRDTDWFTFSSQSEIAEKLNAALNGPHKHPVIAGIRNFVFSDETADGFTDAHVYSVLAFDPSGPDGGTVTIRNPWGDGQNTTRGTIKISVKQFEKNFSSATYAE